MVVTWGLEQDHGTRKQQTAAYFYVIVVVVSWGVKQGHGKHKHQTAAYFYAVVVLPCDK